MYLMLTPFDKIDTPTFTPCGKSEEVVPDGSRDNKSNCTSSNSSSSNVLNKNLLNSWHDSFNVYIKATISSNVKF